MPRGTHAKGGLRSHRRRLGKHLVIAPWVIITVVVAVVFAGLTAGYIYLITRGCNGPTTTATVVADPDIYQIVDQLARDYNGQQHTVNGHCAAIAVVSKDSGSMAAALSPNWDARTDGTRPDVWIPESSLWSRMAASRSDVARMLPDKQPSIARSPIVVAMPKPMADALGGPTPKWTWHDLATTYAGTDWSAYGHPEWTGGFKVAMTDPTVSTAALGALTAIADANGDGDITVTERGALNQLWHVESDYSTDTDTESILQKLSAADQASQTAALRTISAFPAIEQQVAQYNLQTPRVLLQSVYPADGSPEADFPYLVLNWSHANVDAGTVAAHDKVAAGFLTYLRGDTAKQQFLTAGYRDANRKPGPDLTATNGVLRTVPTLPRAVMTPASISQTMAMWTAISRRTNVLIVADTSDAMGQTVPGSNKTRIQIAGGAAADAVNLFGAKARIGLWAYATDLDGSKDYQQIVAPGDINDTVQGTTRVAAIHDSLTQLSTGGQPGLYSTVIAAYQSMREHYVDNAVNQIVVISSGHNSGSTTLSQVTSAIGKVRDSKHPIPVMIVAFGDNVDLSSLQTISQATGGRTYPTDSPTQVPNLLLTAMFSATGLQ